MELIERVTKERGCYRAVIGSETVMIPGALFRERPLEVGATIDLDEYDQWLMVRQYRHALERAVAMLAVRARSRREVEERLLRIGYRPCTAEMVLYKLTREHLLDDADFARQWVEARSGRTIGARRIAQELRQKGVSASDAAEALSAIDAEDELAAATVLAEKALRRVREGEDMRRAHQRIMAMLLRRGFSATIARHAMEGADSRNGCL